MSNYFKELTIPFYPLVNGIVDELYDRKFSDANIRKKTALDIDIHNTACFPYADVDRILNPELLDMFNSLNIKPVVVCNFGALDLSSWQTPIHADLWHKGPGVWGHWPCSINFEITNSDVRWFFYDTKDHQEEPVRDFTLQQIKNSYPKNLLSGSRFGNSPEFVPEEIDQLGFTELDTYVIKPGTWYLNRVEVPHSIKYSNLTDASTRMSIQVKFDLKQVSSWEKGLEVFQSYIAE